MDGPAPRDRWLPAGREERTYDGDLSEFVLTEGSHRDYYAAGLSMSGDSPSVSRRLIEAMRRRAAAATAGPWAVVRDPDGVPAIATGGDDGRLLYITRDSDIAREEDIRFIALARDAVPRLLDALESPEASISAEELAALDAVAAQATPAPWVAFLDSNPAIGGCSIIQIVDEPYPRDMYLWLGQDPAPDEDYDFVAASREDVPTLVAEIRRRRVPLQ